MASEGTSHGVPRHKDLDIRSVVRAQEPVQHGFAHPHVQLFPNRLWSTHTQNSTRKRALSKECSGLGCDRRNTELRAEVFRNNGSGGPRSLRRPEISAAGRLLFTRSGSGNNDRQSVQRLHEAPSAFVQVDQTTEVVWCPALPGRWRKTVPCISPGVSFRCSNGSTRLRRREHESCDSNQQKLRKSKKHRNTNCEKRQVGAWKSEPIIPCPRHTTGMADQADELKKKSTFTSYESQIPVCTCPHKHCFSPGTLLSPTARRPFAPVSFRRFSPSQFPEKLRAGSENAGPEENTCPCRVCPVSRSVSWSCPSRAVVVVVVVCDARCFCHGTV